MTTLKRYYIDLKADMYQTEYLGWTPMVKADDAAREIEQLEERWSRQADTIINYQHYTRLFELKVERLKQERSKLERQRDTALEYQGVLASRVRLLEAEVVKLTQERDCLNLKVREWVKFYDKYVGTPCEEIRHAQEVESLKEERDRLLEESNNTTLLASQLTRMFESGGRFGYTDKNDPRFKLNALLDKYDSLHDQLQEASIEAGLTQGETLVSVIRGLKNMAEDREKRYEYLLLRDKKEAL